MKPARLLVSLAVVAVMAGPARAEALEGNALQPYQMVRSLQLVQDRIADGDHAALPMQKKLLEMIDTRFRQAGETEFEDRRNFQALMVYAMSGGNPSTIADMLSRLEIDELDRQAGAGILGYLLGDVAQARAAMATIDPTAHNGEVGAFLWLVKGSVTAGENAAAGIRMLDHARLASPGTLVEEAALRRTISLAVSSKDVTKFMSASEQYARRFLRSPYASQFAETFVSGIVTLRHDALDLSSVQQTIAWMTAEQARTVYLRLARRAAIDGDRELLDFASARSHGDGDGTTDAFDPRGELYSSISSVTSETVQDVLSQLNELDSSQLSSRDRALLDAARTVAAEVVAPPANPRVLPAAPSVEPGGLETVSVETELPLETDALVTSARSKLEAIDRLLEETPQ